MITCSTSHAHGAKTSLSTPLRVQPYRSCGGSDLFPKSGGCFQERFWIHSRPTATRHTARSTRESRDEPSGSMAGGEDRMVGAMLNDL
ncbi:hypothetical protein DRB96_36405 [Streptomyces sp. ICC1]|nr:hypothetical protein DRB96_36405 [Streptomyces sp. ICC1]